MPAVKIATSVPAEQFRALEETRQHLGLKRSVAIQEALALWLAARTSGKHIANYLRGYQDNPEDADMGAGFVEAWAEGVNAEEW